MHLFFIIIYPNVFVLGPPSVVACITSFNDNAVKLYFYFRIPSIVWFKRYILNTYKKTLIKASYQGILTKSHKKIKSLT